MKKHCRTFSAGENGGIFRKAFLPIKPFVGFTIISLLVNIFFTLGCEPNSLTKKEKTNIAPLSPNSKIVVKNPMNLGVDSLPAERIPVGIAGDYKPCVAVLPDGKLILVFFHGEKLPGEKIREDMIFYRSQDGGRTWSEREKVDLLGREPYFSVTRDGILFITTHLLEPDIRNTDGAIHAYIHRSSDSGKTWDTVKITSENLPGAPAKTWTHSSRNVLDLADGTFIFGVSASKGHDFLWRSRDKGKTWDNPIACEFEGVDEEKLWWPFWAETFLWQTQSGDIIGLWRVDHKTFPMTGEKVPEETSDQYERMIVFRSGDSGEKWFRDQELGSEYGEMYPNIIRLRDGKLLLTFTVRSLKIPLGVQAVFGQETRNGFTFDFTHDRLIPESRTPAEIKSSGGGFGPTVQLADGTLVTSYSYRNIENETHVEIVRWRLP